LEFVPRVSRRTEKFRDGFAWDIAL